MFWQFETENLWKDRSLPELLLLSDEMHWSQPKTTSNSREEGLNVVNHPHVLAAKCGGETGYSYRKTNIGGYAN